MCDEPYETPRKAFGAIEKRGGTVRDPLERRRGVSLLGAVSLLVAVLVAPSPATAHKVRAWESSTAKSIVEDSGQLLADYGSYQLYEVDRLRPDLLQDDKAEVRDDYNRILLDAARIDTTTKAVKALRKPVGDFNGKRMHLIQFVGPMQPAWHEALKKTGAQLIDYIPENAYLVYGDAQSLANLQSLAGTMKSVQWDGEYLDDYKIHPRARLVDEKGHQQQLSTDEFAIQLAQDPDANPATLALIGQLKLEPIRRQYNLLRYVNVFVRLRPGPGSPRGPAGRDFNPTIHGAAQTRRAAGSNRGGQPQRKCADRAGGVSGMVGKQGIHTGTVHGLGICGGHQ